MRAVLQFRLKMHNEAHSTANLQGVAHELLHKKGIRFSFIFLHYLFLFSWTC